MAQKFKKYSPFITPLIIFWDVVLINLIIYYFLDKEYLNIQFFIYITCFWLSIGHYTKFYNTYRYTHVIKLLTRLISHFFVFSLAFFSYFTIFNEGNIISKQSNIILFIIFTIIIFKLLSFFILKKYRSKGKNYKNVIVFGERKAAQNIATLFNKRQDLGYRFYGFFSDKESKSKKHLGNFDEGLRYISENKIDEVFCEDISFTKSQSKKIREFCIENKIEFSLIPENKAIYSKGFVLEYYGIIPVLKPKKLPFERMETFIVKRVFDIVFSFLVCLLLLSWFLPILWLIVRINSKGPFFFRQIRDGADGKQFFCYKVRSMHLNSLANQISTSKNDNRITSVGAFLRKTSIDELPQFFNVLFGDMSVIGPRPHMNIETEKYVKEIDNYLIRNSIKPGITGLAQVSGYRGEVRTKCDIENRVRYDIFYIENWSFFLDIKIIFQTFSNVFKGEEKAY